MAKRISTPKAASDGTSQKSAARARSRNRNRSRRPGQRAQAEQRKQAVVVEMPEDLDAGEQEEMSPPRRRRPPTSASKLRRGASAVARGIGETAAPVVEAVTANPVPSILIGAGLTWFLMDRVNRRTRLLDRAGRSLGDAAGTVGERLSDVGGSIAGRVGEVLSDAAGTVKDRVAEAASTVKDRVVDAAGKVGERATRLGEYAQAGASDAARRGYEAGRNAVTQTWEQYPLAMGLAALAAGLAAGMMLPATRVEQNVMGDTAEEMARRVREATEELVRRGKRAASAAAEATAREAARVGLAPDELQRKIKHLVTTARGAASSCDVTED